MLQEVSRDPAQAWCLGSCGSLDAHAVSAARTCIVYRLYRLPGISFNSYNILSNIYISILFLQWKALRVRTQSNLVTSRDGKIWSSHLLFEHLVDTVDETQVVRDLLVLLGWKPVRHDHPWPSRQFSERHLLSIWTCGMDAFFHHRRGRHCCSENLFDISSVWAGMSTWSTTAVVEKRQQHGLDGPWTHAPGRGVVVSASCGNTYHAVDKYKDDWDPNAGTRYALSTMTK